MRMPVSYLVVALLAAAATYAAAQVNPLRQPPPPVVLPALKPVPVPEVVDISPEERVNMLVYERVNRSVVNLTTRGVQEDDFFFLTAPREGSGSGSVLDKQGHVLTNYHVIEDARQMTVNLYDGSSHPARLIGS